MLSMYDNVQSNPAPVPMIDSLEMGHMAGEGP